MQDQDDVVSSVGQDTGDVFEEVADSQHPTFSPAQGHSEKSALFRMTYAKRQRGKKFRRIATISGLVILMLAIVGGAFYFLRRIYYLQQPDIQLGAMALKLDLAEAKEQGNPIAVADMFDKVSGSFTIVDASAYKGLRRAAVKRGPSKRPKRGGAKTPTAAKPKKPKAGGSPMDLLKKAGYK